MEGVCKIKKSKTFLKWVEEVIKDKGITKAQYFYDNYGNNQHTITIEKGYKPK